MQLIFLICFGIFINFTAGKYISENTKLEKHYQLADHVRAKRSPINKMNEAIGEENGIRRSQKRSIEILGQKIGYEYEIEGNIGLMKNNDRRKRENDMGQAIADVALNVIGIGKGIIDQGFVVQGSQHASVDIMGNTAEAGRDLKVGTGDAIRRRRSISSIMKNDRLKRSPCGRKTTESPSERRRRQVDEDDDDDDEDIIVTEVEKSEDAGFWKRTTAYIADIMRSISEWFDRLGRKWSGN